MPTRSFLNLSIFLAALMLGAGCGGSEPSDDAGSGTKPASSQAVEPAPGPTPTPAPNPQDPAATLPIEQLAGELVMTKLVGQQVNDDELDAIRSLHLGGIILFGPNVADETQLKRLTSQLNDARAPAAAAAGLPTGVLISVDQEGGAIRNVPFAPPEQTQPSLASGSIADARATAVATGRALHEVGINMDLGPVADLAQPPNRTMAGRSFGEDPATVSRYVGATVEGLQQGGVAAAAKHFPAFGAATANTDEAVAYVDRTIDQIQSNELQPYEEAVRRDVDVIMVSHGIHRKLGSTLPGTLDPKIATGLLRDELGFDGVAMTDSMNARGLREAWGDTVPRACPVAIAAGIDLMLLTGTIETARLCRARIITAVRDGTLDEARVREAAGRVIALRTRRAGS
jgi:beta-N-acetylhexosaminidase